MLRAAEVAAKAEMDRGEHTVQRIGPQILPSIPYDFPFIREQRDKLFRHHLARAKA